MIQIVHARRLPVRACEARAAIDELGRDRLVPDADAAATDYRVTRACEEVLEVAFAAAGGVCGVHRVEVIPDRLACVVRHTVDFTPKPLATLSCVAARPRYRAMLSRLLDDLQTEVTAAAAR